LLRAKCLHLLLYFSTEYHNSSHGQYNSLLEILVDIIRSEAWLSAFWENINGLFAVYCGTLPEKCKEHSSNMVGPISLPWLQGEAVGWEEHGLVTLLLVGGAGLASLATDCLGLILEINVSSAA
jgi:hypothetical protein